MKILFLVIGNKLVASSRVRVYSYVPYLRKKGFKVFVMNYTPSWQCKRILADKKKNLIAKMFSRLHSAAAVLILCIAAPFFDVVYIQKVALSKFSLAILKALNRRIVFDFDDAIFLYQDITHLLKNSISIVVSNKYLKEYASRYNKRVYELISPVSAGDGPFEKDANSVTVGWIGSPDTSAYLKELIPTLSSLKEKHKDLNIEFMGIKNDKNFDLPSYMTTTEWSIRGEQRYLERLHIGIMPLKDDGWTRGKGGYKLLQYMAAGVPCVASAVGINKEIIREGINGFLADTPQEWVDKLSLLINDSSLRQRLGQEGLKAAKMLYSYQANAPKLIEILKQGGR